MPGCPEGKGRVGSWRLRLSVGAVLAVVTILWLVLAGAADAQGGQEVISSAGPMTSIYLNDDLSCQVQMANDTTLVFFGGTDVPLINGGVVGACGTFMQVNQATTAGNLLFGPTVAAGNATPDYTPVSQTIGGTGSSTNPYTVTTIADATPTNSAPLARLTEVDTYVVGSDAYDTALTITNQSRAQLTGTLYHTGDCFLQGDDGYGGLGTGPAPQCALTPNNSPSARVVSFVPGNGATPHYYEGVYDTFWTDITTTGTPYPDTIDATTLEDNGLGLSWAYTVPQGGTTTISYSTVVTPAQTPSNTAPPVISGTPAVGQVLTCSTGTWSGSGPITYIFQWLLDGNPIAGAASNTYIVASGDQGHSLACQVTAINGIGSAAQTSASDQVPTGTAVPSGTAVPTVPAVPTVSPQPPTVTGTQGATFAAAVNPNGSATTVHFEYGLDPKYGLTTASNLYVGRTVDQPVASGFSPQVVIAGVTGLVPNALYHVRVVATNSIGTVTGADQTFRTATVPPPQAPVLGREANFAPTSGIVYVKAPPGAHIAGLPAGGTGHAPGAPTRGHGFIPLTEALQFPVGTQVDARNGKLKVTTATTTGGKGKRTKTQSGEFSQGLFQVLQSNKRSLKGLTVLKLLDTGIFPGAPSYKTECAVAGKASAQIGERGRRVVFRPRKLSRRVLQTLLAGEHGSYQTQGRYSAATVRGTVFTVTDRCDGTLTHVQRGTVVVNVYRQRTNITVRTGHQYLAKAP